MKNVFSLLSFAEHTGACFLRLFTENIAQPGDDVKHKMELRDPHWSSRSQVTPAHSPPTAAERKSTAS